MNVLGSCVICGKKDPKGRRDTPRYCSDCRALLTTRCLGCGSELRVRRGGRIARYCGDRCAARAAYRRRLTKSVRVSPARAVTGSAERGSDGSRPTGPRDAVRPPLKGRHD